MIQAFKNTREKILKDLKINCHTALVQLFPSEKGFNEKVVSMEFLALPVVIFKPVGSGKRLFYAKGKHDDNLHAGVLKVNGLTLKLWKRTNFAG